MEDGKRLVVGWVVDGLHIQALAGDRQEGSVVVGEEQVRDLLEQVQAARIKRQGELRDRLASLEKEGL